MVRLCIDDVAILQKQQLDTARNLPRPSMAAQILSAKIPPSSVPLSQADHVFHASVDRLCAFTNRAAREIGCPWTCSRDCLLVPTTTEMNAGKPWRVSCQSKTPEAVPKVT